MEYPIILVQEIILIFLVLNYMALLGTNSFACFGLYIAITGAFLSGLLPKTILAVLAVSTTMHHEEHVISEVCWEIVLLTSYEFS
jgi:hypothetical protein